MKVISIALSLAFLPLSYAETMIWAAWINGIDQGDGRDRYIRSPPTNAPIKSLQSDDIRCGIGGRTAAPTSLKVKAGDTLDFEWHANVRSSTDIIIDPGQKGAIQIYMAPASSNGEGNVWVKMLSADYSPSYKKWATQALVEQRGMVGIWVPSIPPGKYLVRPEILALHEADELYSKNSRRGIQVYTGCVQIEITSSNWTLTLPPGIAFPGAYKDTTPGILWNIYSLADPKTYKAPGGDLWSGAMSGISVQQDPTKPRATPWPYWYNFR